MQVYYSNASMGHWLESLLGSLVYGLSELLFSLVLIGTLYQSLLQSFLVCPFHRLEFALFFLSYSVKFLHLIICVVC